MSSSKTTIISVFVLLAEIIAMCSFAAAGKMTGFYILLTAIFVEAVIFTYAAVHSEWRCEKCGTTFKPKFSQVLFSINAGDVKIMRCPHCESKQDCKPIENKKQ